MDLLDLLRRETLVAAVIPLDQIRPYLGALPISRQAAGLERALERACQNERKRPRSKPRAERPCLSLPLLGQGKVGRAGVPAAKTPFRFPVPRQHHRLGHRTQPVRTSTCEAPPLISMSKRSDAEAYPGLSCWKSPLMAA